MDEELKELLDQADMNYKNALTAFYKLSDILDKIRQNNGGR